MSKCHIGGKLMSLLIFSVAEHAVAITDTSYRLPRDIDHVIIS